MQEIKTSPLLINLFWVSFVLVVVIFLTSFIYSLVRPGLKKLTIFSGTICALSFISCLIFFLGGHLSLYLTTVGRNLLDILPLRTFIDPHQPSTLLALRLGVMALFFILALLLLRHQNKATALQLTWLIVLLPNITETVLATWHYFSYAKPPAPAMQTQPNDRLLPQDIILGRTGPSRSMLAWYIVYPLFWSITAAAALIKTRKEVRRSQKAVAKN
jgi:hypothetical protein